MEGFSNGLITPENLKFAANSVGIDINDTEIEKVIRDVNED